MWKTRRKVSGLLPGAGPQPSQHELGTRKLEAQILNPPGAAWHGDRPVGGRLGEKRTPRSCAQKVLKTPSTVLTQSRPRPRGSFQGGFLEEVARWMGLEHSQRGKEGIGPVPTRQFRKVAGDSPGH